MKLTIIGEPLANSRVVWAAAMLATVWVPVLVLALVLFAGAAGWWLAGVRRGVEIVAPDMGLDVGRWVEVRFGLVWE